MLGWSDKEYQITIEELEKRAKAIYERWAKA